MRAFVTGGSGFVGRNLIRVLVARGDTVVALARSDASAKTVEEAGAQSVSGDLDDVDAMTDGMRGCDTVFHSAAEVRDWGSPDLFHRSNVTGTENTLEAARNAGVKCFVHVGTEAVLVDGHEIVNADETRPLPDRPIGLYPITKGMAESRVRAADSPEMKTVVIRPRLIWGRDDTTLLTQFIQAIKAGRFVWVSGGRYKTSTCHVLNVCKGAILAAEKGRGGEAYFLTDGEPTEFRAFITEMMKTQGVRTPNTSIPRWLAYAIGGVSEYIWRTFGLKGVPPITRSIVVIIGGEVTVNDAKARAELGYQPVITREQGLKEMAGAE